MFSLIKAPENVLWGTCHMGILVYVIFWLFLWTVPVYMMKRQRCPRALTLKKSKRTWSVLKCFLFLHCVRVVILSQCSAPTAQWIEPVSSAFVERSAHFDSVHRLIQDSSVYQPDTHRAFCWPDWNSVLNATVKLKMHSKISV